MQVEYSLDVVFKRREVLAPLYEEISRQAMLTVCVPDMARFWGKRFSPEAEAGSDFKTLVEGTRIKHVLGRQSLKMYDKGGRVLRIEATTNDITFFCHHRKVVSRTERDGKARTWRGFNVFLKEDQQILLALLRGEFAIDGLGRVRD